MTPTTTNSYGTCSIIVIKKERYWPQILAVVSLCLCSTSVGLNLGWASPYIPELLDPENMYNYTSEEVSYIAVIHPLGFLIGAPLSGYLANAIGRKYALLAIGMPQIVAWTILGLTQSVVMFCIGRVISGIAEVSTYMLIPMYIGEISLPRIRGILTTFLSLSIGVGTVLINIIGTFTTLSQGSFICMMVPLLFVLTFTWMPESPYYYIMKGKLEKARESLQTLRRLEDVTDELTQLNIDVRRQMSESGTFKDIFLIPSNLLALVIIISMRSFQHYSGITAFLMYGRKLFEDVGSCISASTSAIMISLSSIVLVAAGSFLIDRFGRKPLIIISCSTSATMLATMALYYYMQQFHGVNLSWMPFVTTIIYMLTYSIGLGVTPNVLMGEMLSVSVKSKALVIVNIMTGITMSTSTKLFQVLSDAYGYYSPFILYTCCCIAGSIFAYVFIPETRGKTLEEIQTVMKQSTNAVAVSEPSDGSFSYNNSTAVSTIDSSFEACNNVGGTKISAREYALMSACKDNKAITDDSGNALHRNYDTI